MAPVKHNVPTSNFKRPTRRSTSVKINYSDASPTKVVEKDPLDIRANLSDALTNMANVYKVNPAKTKNPPPQWVIGNRKTTTVRELDPEVVILDDDQDAKKTTSFRPILPKHLLVTKINDPAGVKNNKQGVTITTSEKSIATSIKHGRQEATPNKGWLPIGGTTTLSSIRKVNALPGISIKKTKASPNEKNAKVAMEVIDKARIVVTPPKINVEKEHTMAKNTSLLITSNQKKPIENALLTRASGRNTSPLHTSNQKKPIENVLLTRVSGRRKPPLQNSQKKSFVKTIKKLNPDQKKRIQGRLGDIGSNLQKIKPKEEAEESGEKIAPEPEPIVDKRPLSEILSDVSWLEMFLQTEPTARYNAANDTIYCATCKEMLGEDEVIDGWGMGHPKGVEWLKYEEHKLGENHQRTSTKYFMQLFTAKTQSEYKPSRPSPKYWLEYKEVLKKVLNNETKTI